MKLEIEIDDEVYTFLKTLGEMVDRATGSTPKTPEMHAKMILLESLWIMAKQVATGIHELAEAAPKKDDLN